MTQPSVCTFAEHLIAARKAAGETQAQFAPRLGISQPRLSEIEAGGRPSLAFAVRCSSVLGIELRELLAQYRAEEMSAASGPA